jgi:FdhD protein
MRTPGHDHELVAGFLYTEGLIHTRHEIVAIQTESSADDPAPRNVVTVHLTRPINPTAVQRNFYTTSSCGICGKASLDQIAVHCAPVAAMAQVPIVCAVSAPSSLAVEVAQRFRMTLVGFLRETQCNVYAHPERLRLDH